MSNAKLDSCPFCGGEADTVWHHGYWSVTCNDCFAEVTDDDECVAIAKWNTRKPMVKLIDKLDQAAFAVYDEEDDEDMWVVDLHKAIDLVKGVQNE